MGRAATLVLLVSFVFLFSLPTQSQSEEASFSLVSASPFNHGVLEPDSAITLTFNHSLNCNSVEGSLTITPTIPFEIHCEGAVVALLPELQDQSPAAYRLNISRILRTREGQPLDAPIEFIYYSGEVLRVTEAFPAANAVDINANAVISVVFSHPVVPLSLIEARTELPDPLRFAPSVEGKGEWINTFVYRYTPDQPLLPGIEYTVTIEDDLRASDSTEMAAPYTWSFTTQNPRVTQIRFKDNTSYDLRPVIAVYLNTPLYHEVLESAFSLREVRSSVQIAPETFTSDSLNTLPTQIELGEAVSGTFEWYEDDMIAYFQPDEPLENGTTYAAQIDRAAVRANFDVTLEGENQWTFATVPLPEVVSISPENGSESAVYNGFSIEFNTYMDADSITERLNIDPEPEIVNAYRYFKTYQFVFPAEASTTYTVRIDAGIEDIHGNVYDQPIEFSYTTVPYEPTFDLYVPQGRMGFYSAYKEDTSLFVRHRNIDRIGVQLYTLTPEMFVDLLTDSVDENEDAPTLYNYAPPRDTLLREWRVDLQNVLNIDLPSQLTLGENSACTSRLATDLQVGDIARIRSDGAVSALNFPVDGAEIISLFDSFEVPLVGGPLCTDEVIWWQIEVGGTRAWLPEQHDGKALLEYVETTRTSEVDIDQQNSLAPGLYVLRVHQDTPAPRESRYVQHTMMVMTANLTLKTSLAELLVWATDVQSGEPLPGLPLTIYNGAGIVAAGVTDEDGLLVVAYDDRLEDLVYQSIFAIANTDTHFGVGMTGWADGIDPGLFDERAAFRSDPYVNVIYTDRQVYRPGDTLYFRGIVRAAYDMTYTVPTEFNHVRVSVNLVGIDTPITQEVPLTPFGTYSGEIQIPESAPVNGYNTIDAHVQIGSDDPLSLPGRVIFTIAEFRLPEFRVDVQPNAENVIQGEPIEVAVGGEYYSSGAVSDATVEYQVISSPLSFHYTGRGRYRFDNGLFDERSEFSREISEGSSTTGVDGSVLLGIPSDLGEIANSQRFTIEVTMRDETDQTVSNRTTVDVHAGEWYIGTRPERYINRAGREVSIDTILVDWVSEGIADQPLDVEVVERRWYSVQETDPLSGRTAWVWDYEDIPVTEDQIVTDDDGRAAYAFVPQQGGLFRVIFRTRDTQGYAIANAADIWVAGANYIPWRMENHYRIPLIADQETYEVGDTAEILIASPFQGDSYALITVERYGVMTSEMIHLRSNSYIYRLDIEEDFAPNIFVSVMIVGGVDETNRVSSFRMGLLRLPVSIREKTLDIEISVNTDLAQPGDSVTYHLRAVDHNGEPAHAEIGVALTDAAALAVQTTMVSYYGAVDVSDPNWVANIFYQEQGLGVRTSTPLTISTDQITQNIIDEVKGGGGGDGGELTTLFNVREDFESTTFWEGHLITDENGEAEFTVTLPDNLTTWHLTAYAVTNAAEPVTRLGSGSHDLVSTTPLIIRPVTPRFMTTGDEATLAAVVNNNTREALTVDVTLEASGVTLSSPMTQTVIIESNSRVRINWRAVVNDDAEAELIFYAVSDDNRYRDASRPPLGQGDNRTLPIYRYSIPETVATAGILREAGTRTEQIALPTDIPFEDAQLVVEIEPSLAGVTAAGLDYLKHYPHQCIEQTVSRFLPNIITFRALDSLGLADARLRRNLETAVQFALQKLSAEQKPDGGWGWVLAEHSDSLTTAYALIGLAEARQQGFTVNSVMMTRAADYLQTQLITVRTTETDWQLNRQAFILYALAAAGRPNVAQTSNLYEYRERLSLDARAFLSLTLHLIEPEITIRTDALLSDFHSLAIVSATGTHWEESRPDRWNWNTDIRTNALILKVLVELEPDSELIPNVVRWLMTQRQNRAWSTTQETAWSVMALTDWMLISGDLDPNYTATLRFNQQTHFDQTISSENIDETFQLTIDVQSMLTDEANQLVLSRSEGQGALYYTAQFNVVLPVAEVESLASGIVVERGFYQRNRDDERVRVDEARVGELIDVRLLIVAPNDLHYVNIESPIPAGAEVINPNLRTSQQLGTSPLASRIDPDWGWSWWWFSHIEYRDEKVVLSASYLPAGTYEMVYRVRALLPGTYHVIPSSAYEFYFPEVHGRSEGQSFTILPADVERLAAD
jgi:hypothetical protein